MTFKVELTLDDAAITRRVHDTAGDAQRNLMREIIRTTEPYVPADTGLLSQSPWSMSDWQNGVIVYGTPYAHYMDEGIIFGPNIPIRDGATGETVGFFSPPGRKKTPTGRPIEYNKEVHPLAGPHYFQRSQADNQEDWNRVAKATFRQEF